MRAAVYSAQYFPIGQHGVARNKVLEGQEPPSMGPVSKDRWRMRDGISRLPTQLNGVAKGVGQIAKILSVIHGA